MLCWLSKLLFGFSSQKGAVGVKQPYIRVVGLEQTSGANSNGPSNFTLDEASAFGKKN